MMVAERESGDLLQLRELINRECDALRRDRYRTVRLALEGKETLDIVDRLDRSRRSVQDWVYAYRDGGIDAGPRPEDGVCTLRGKDVVRILALLERLHCSRFPA